MASSKTPQPAVAATVFSAASPPVQPDLQTINENIRSIKRKVISVHKLEEVFRIKDTETAALKQRLEDVQKEAVTLREQLQNVPPPSTELAQLRELAEKQVQLAEQARMEAEEAKSKQKAADEDLARLTQKLRGIEMLNTQLEAKSVEMVDLQKRLANAQKEHDQAMRKSKIDASDLRARLMKADAEKADRLEWLADQKKRWENEEERREGKRTQELLIRVDELEHQLEDSRTEHYLEAEMATEQLKNTQEKLKITQGKLDDSNGKIKVLNHTIIDLRHEKGTLESQIDMLERRIDAYAAQTGAVEDFEEIVPEQSPVSPTKPTRTENVSVRMVDPMRAEVALSGDRLDRAIGTIEDLKSQFTLLRMFPGSPDDKQRLAALVEEVKVLNKEKQALQNELTRRLVEAATATAIPQAPPAPYVPPIFNPPAPIINPSGDTTRVSAPISSDTIAWTDAPKRVGRKRKIVEPQVEPSVQRPVHPIEEALEPDLYMPEPTDEGFSSHVPQTTVVDEKKARKPRTPGPSASLPKLKKPRTSRKSLKASSDDLTHLEIRNISVNPLIPTIATPRLYFSLAMNSAIVDDIQLYTKLAAIATILPAKLNDLIEAVQSKAREIAPKVSTFRAEHDPLQDITKSWISVDFEPIEISESLCRAEVFIVQFLCLLDSRFPEMGIVNKIFAAVSETILKGTATGENLENLSVMMRVLTGLCRAHDDIERPRILAYDILRDITDPKGALVLCEAIASIWPSIFIVANELDDNDPKRLMLTVFQGVLGTHQAATEGLEISFGFDTFTQKCSWPAVANAPYMDELTNEMMNIVRSETFADLCLDVSGYEFGFSKALELALVNGFDWIEICNKYLSTTLVKLMGHETLYSFAIPLVTAVTRESRFGSTGTSVGMERIREVLDGILAAPDLPLDLCVYSALAMVELSCGQEELLATAKDWHRGLSERDRVDMPAVLRELLL